MFEMRFHGRGGQGAVTSAELTAQAAIAEGKFGQAFPSFGPERRGAPVMAFARTSQEQIRNRSAVYEPDAVLVLDASLLKLVDVSQGMDKSGTLIVSSAQSPEKLREEYGFKCRIASIDALTIAMETIRRPITNTTMLGALVKATGIVGQEAMEEAVTNRFGPLARRNIIAMKKAIETVKISEPS